MFSVGCVGTTLPSAPSIEHLVQEWLRLDKDPMTRAEIEQLAVDGNHDELELRLRKRIAFGTAGLRAKMSAGFSRMNSLTVIQASQGLAEYLLSKVADARGKGVVIGRDARHNSEKFANLTAAAFLTKGFKVYLLGQVPTPTVPFAINYHSAAAGVMVTASHNPAADNGYKVYWGNGCQIIPPHDSGISDSIERNLEPITWDTSIVANASEHLILQDAAVRGSYVHAVARAAKSSSSADISFTYTPMHGVGLEILQDVLKVLSYDEHMHVVQSQATPDPDFPTVKFPNPEESGALDEAKKTADFHGDELILANDPDADRFAVAVKVDGSWQQLTGNQVGVLFPDFLLNRHAQSGTNVSEKGVMLASAVSSRMLFKWGEHRNIKVEETLTGFKWLGNRAIDLERQGYEALFAYEEALGYMFPEVVHDKDGIAAAAIFLTACQHWRMQSHSSPWQTLQRLYEMYGYFREANTYLVSPAPEVTNKVFEDIRASSPKILGRKRILRWRDLTKGYDAATEDHVPLLPVDKAAQMITCEIEGDVVFTVRGSGTEPKIKLYIEGRGPSAAEAQARADTVLQALLAEWFKPEVYGLRLA